MSGHVPRSWISLKHTFANFSLSVMISAICFRNKYGLKAITQKIIHETLKQNAIYSPNSINSDMEFWPLDIPIERNRVPLNREDLESQDKSLNEAAIKHFSLTWSF